ncbi:hypothetical protein K491DRAFT_608173 [Lophiostoma macrostomum CBS 122681]|uniref:G-protein coupled receptors family 1 profile domain-containing protein n=1 Tax=Lophiostoma macrostomum CBS 122681 TaxID=1314788 RepID=A0A6A6ST02_9PLEO|nr:hypothetical protein K491DRAFT_608173 [Lophiostoma macrostomum CBS 122681]
MRLMAWLWFSGLLSAGALSSPTVVSAAVSRSLNPREDADRTIYAGERPSDRTIYTVLSLFCMMVLSLMLGSRFSKLRKNAMMKRNITSILVLILYVLVISFIVCTAVMLSGQGLYNHGLCTAATWICLLLYTAVKLVIYVFIVERVHIVRAPFVRRSRDWLYIISLVVMLISFGAVAINAYLSPIIEMDPADGRCHMGIPGKASIPFMTVDIAVNVALTSIFFYLLRPVVKLHGVSSLSGVFGSNTRRRIRDVETEIRKGTNIQRAIRTLLWKSLFGSMLIMLPTVANMVQFYIMSGKELALICLTLCTMDVSWDTIVIHWLTFGSAEAEKDLTRSLTSSYQARRNQSETPILEHDVRLDTPRPDLMEPQKAFATKTMLREPSDDSIALKSPR